jgi:sigma-B regulation protein RsbU (phosphoserine phosphatase)
VQEVPKLAAFVDEVCEWMGFDPMLTMQLNLAIEEAVVNVMDYAYPPGTKGEVDIEVKADADELMFTISDNGVAFDPTAKAEVDTTLSAEERQIGGLGIHLVRHIMDNVEYERKDGRNILRLSKKR